MDEASDSRERLHELMNDFLLVSFATKPNSGSERGVGWAFVEAARELSQSSALRIHVVLDSRDKEAVIEGLASNVTDNLVLHFVGTPRIISSLLGRSKSRLSYCLWLPFARSKIRAIARANRVAVAHQVTFASFVMPSALPVSLRRNHHVKTVWGPASIATNPVPSWPTRAKDSKLSGILIRLSSRWSVAQANSVDLAIANNAHTLNLLDGKKSKLEPNIFLDPKIFQGIDTSLRNDRQIIMVGVLSERKRPWLAIEALATPALASYKLQIVGEGPLMSDLVALCSRLGVAERVEFKGRLSHSDSLAAMSESEIVLHPSCREGSPWVIGEATSMGVPCVVFAGSGADTTLAMSGAVGEIVPYLGDPVKGIVDAVEKLGHNSLPRQTTQKWSSQRAVALLKEWWELPPL